MSFNAKSIDRETEKLYLRIKGMEKNLLFIFKQLEHSFKNNI